MFEKLVETLKKLAVSKARFDPACFNDPVALSTEWTPLKGGGTNFGTHKLVSVSPERMEFKAAWGAKVFYGIFLLAGLSVMSIIPVASWNQGQRDAAAILVPMVLGLVFGGIGGGMMYFGTKPIVFDRRIGCYWKDRRDPAKEFNRQNIKSLKELSELHALQLVSERCSGKNSSYYSYELNLVFKDGSRVNVVDHGNLNRIREDAHALGSFLGVPLWDVVG